MTDPRAMKTLAVVMVVAWPAAALADNPEHFVSLDRQDFESRAGVDISYINPPSGGGGTTALSFDPHAQYLGPSGLGAYVNAPIAYVSGGGNSATSLADIDVGGIYTPRLATPGFGLVLHAGITLPTQSNAIDKNEASLIGLTPRLTDFYLVVPGGFSLRIGASPIWRSGQMFARLDLGLDSNLGASNGTKVDNAEHVNFGAGVDFGQAALMGEITNLHVDGNNSVWVDEGGLSARFIAGTVQLYAAVMFSLDKDAGQLFDQTFTGGLEGRLH